MEYISVHGLVEGDRLPSERELCVLLDVSRTTLRSALAQLVAEHVVESRPGAGSFVCPSRPTNHLDDLSGFSEIVRKTGAEPRSRVIGSGIIACPDEIAGRLNLAAGDHVFELRRVRGVEDVAVCVETAYVPASAFPGIEGIDFARESLTDVLGIRYGRDTVHTRLTVSVRRASAEEAALLSISEGALVFFECGVRADASYAPLEYGETVYVPELFGMSYNTVFTMDRKRRVRKEVPA